MLFLPCAIMDFLLVLNEYLGKKIIQLQLNRTLIDNDNFDEKVTLKCDSEDDLQVLLAQVRILHSKRQKAVNNYKRIEIIDIILKSDI